MLFRGKNERSLDIIRGGGWAMKAKVVEDYIMFKPSPKPLHDETEDDIWFLFRENKLMMFKDGENYTLPKLRDLKALSVNLINVQCMGAYREKNCHCGEFKGEIEDKNVVYMDLMTLSEIADRDTYTLAAKGNLLLKWLKLNKYCGVCGAPTYLKDSYTERALVCSKCGNTTWPRTSPAIIVAVTKEDKLLLVYNNQFPERKYSVIAGFVEYGETFEECVKREVYEEAGIRIKNIKYFGSQPWPFPNSMMVAFTAEYLEGELMADGEEIAHAGWFSKEEIEGKYDNSMSIGTQLIKWFIENH